MPTLRQFRYLMALSQTENIGRAAELCNVSAPALSEQIKAIEDELGVALFERRTSGCVATPAGSDVATRAAKILAATRDLCAAGGSYREPLVGRLSIGIITTIATYLLPKVLPLLNREFPELKFVVCEAQTDELNAKLHAGELDCAVLATAPETNDLVARNLFVDEFVLVLPPGEAATDDASAIIDANQLYLLSDGHCFRDQALEVCGSRVEQATDLFGAASLGALAALVAGGLGQTLLPRLAVEHETAGLDVQLVEFPKPVPSRTVKLTWRRTSPRKADFEALEDVIQRACG